MQYKCRNDSRDPRKLHVLTHGITAILLIHYCDITDGGYVVYVVFSSVLQCVAPFQVCPLSYDITACGYHNLLQHDAVCCRMLHCVAVHYSVFAPPHATWVTTLLQYVQVSGIDQNYSMFKWVVSTKATACSSAMHQPLLQYVQVSCIDDAGS